MISYGNGQPAPPIVSREFVELQRAASRIAAKVKERMPQGHWLNIEADIRTSLLRLVFHYRKGNAPKAWHENETVEVNLVPGHPLDDLAWLSSIADEVLELIESGSSDLIIPKFLDYVRYVDDSGKTVFEEGKSHEHHRSFAPGYEGKLK